MTEYDIDIDYLITLIKERPVLWDKTTDDHKDKFLRTDAWKSVCTNLLLNFDLLDKEDRRKFTNNVIKKWRGVKDNFMKYEKKVKELNQLGSGAKKIKQYHFYKQLLFLSKNQQTETGSGLAEGDDLLGRASSSLLQSQKIEIPLYEPSTRKRKLAGEDFEDNVLAALKSPENRHVSFFKGILPSVEKLDDTQTLIFQSRVLQILTELQLPSYYHGHQPPAQGGFQTSFPHSGYETSPSTLQSPQTSNQDIDDAVKNEPTNSQIDYNFA